MNASLRSLRRWRAVAVPLLLPLLVSCATPSGDLAPTVPVQFLERGVEAASRSAWAEAIACFEQARQADPWRPEPLYNLALVHDRAGGREAIALLWYRAFLAAETTGTRARWARNRVTELEAAVQQRARAMLTLALSLLPAADNYATGEERAPLMTLLKAHRGEGDRICCMHDDLLEIKLEERGRVWRPARMGVSDETPEARLELVWLVRRMLGDALAAWGDSQGAERVLDVPAEYRDKDMQEQAARHIAVLLILHGRPELAGTFTDRAGTDPLEQQMIAERLLHDCVQAADVAQAGELIEQLAAKGMAGEAEEARCELAEALLDRGDRAAARQVLGTIKDPGQPAPLYRLPVLLARAGDAAASLRARAALDAEQRSTVDEELAAVVANLVLDRVLIGDPYGAAVLAAPYGELVSEATWGAVFDAQLAAGHLKGALATGTHLVLDTVRREWLVDMALRAGQPDTVLELAKTWPAGPERASAMARCVPLLSDDGRDLEAAACTTQAETELGADAPWRARLDVADALAAIGRRDAAGRLVAGVPVPLPGAALDEQCAARVRQAEILGRCRRFQESGEAFLDTLGMAKGLDEDERRDAVAATLIAMARVAETDEDAAAHLCDARELLRGASGETYGLTAVAEAQLARGLVADALETINLLSVRAATAARPDLLARVALTFERIGSSTGAAKARRLQSICQRAASEKARTTLLRTQFAEIWGSPSEWPPVVLDAATRLREAQAMNAAEAVLRLAGDARELREALEVGTKKQAQWAVYCEALQREVAER